MAVHKLKRIGKGKTSKQFMGDAFELGRSGKEWFGSTRPKGKSWCGGGSSGGSKSKGKKSMKDDY